MKFGGLHRSYIILSVKIFFFNLENEGLSIFLMPKCIKLKKENQHDFGRKGKAPMSKFWVSSLR